MHGHRDWQGLSHDTGKRDGSRRLTGHDENGGTMRRRLCFIPVGVIVALALMTTGALATGRGGTTTACSNETLGKQTMRFVLIGRV
jgi:hypothetical protein